MRGHRHVGTAVTTIIVATAFTALCAPANAAFPGQDGRVYFYDDGPRSIQPDGSGEAPIPVSGGYVVAWSPAGGRIAFETSSPENGAEVKVANADGTGVHTIFDGSLVPTENSGPPYVDALEWSPDGKQVVSGWQVFYDEFEGESTTELWVTDLDTGDTRFLAWARPQSGLSWSPRGDRIAFTRTGIYTIRPDGTGLQSIPGSRDLREPDYSPDGTKFVAVQDLNDYPDLVVLNADGSGMVKITDDANAECPINHSPQWSPEGDQIAFHRSYECLDPRPDGVYIVNADGSGLTFLTSAYRSYLLPHRGGPPDWQPVPINSYPRPKGASPLRLSLVPAFQQCLAPDRSHGSPLAHPACASPALASGHLTIGTEDANGHPAESRGQVRITRMGETPVDTTNGDQADITYALQLTDVRNASDLTDYTGELEAQIALRLTDRDNSPSPLPTGAATVADTTLSLTASCAATDSPDTGATCTASTTADALVPGTVKEAQRAVWELGEVRVFDGGDDGDADTGPNTLFATQGVFVP